MTTSNRTRAAVAALGLSAAAFVGLLQHEGFRDRAYFATADEQARGINTIGFGTTQGVKPGETITVERALGRALTDSAKFEGAIKRCVTVPLHQHEYDAAVLLSYNIGEGAFCRSTVVRRFNAGDYAGACDAFLMWNKQSGRVLPGLTKRREAERRLCLGLAAADNPKGAKQSLAPVANREAMPNGFVRKAQLVGPIAEVHEPPIVLIDHAGTAVPDLLLAGGPSAVFGAVGAVVVNSVEAEAVGRIAHVGQEVFKHGPAFTDVDAAPTVLGVSNGIWVRASLSHASPHVVYLSAGLSVPKHGVWHVLGNAPAGLLPAMSSVVAECFHGVAAVALEKPAGLPIAGLVFDALQGNKAPKPLASQINELHSDAIYSAAKHGGPLT